MGKEKSSNKLLGAGVISAIAASLCCITPVLALISGASGAASAFSWMEPLRPYLIGITVLVLGFAWYQKLKAKKEIECDCETDEKPSFWQSKLFLSIATVFAVIMLAFPYYSEVFYSENKQKMANNTSANLKEITLEITGMTCAGCEAHIKHTTNELDGVIESDANYEKGEAVIKYDASRTDSIDIVNAINITGYKVKNYE